MLVRQFKLKRNNDEGHFRWRAHSEIDGSGFYCGLTALLRRREGTESLERLSGLHRQVSTSGADGVEWQLISAKQPAVALNGMTIWNRMAVAAIVLLLPGFGGGQTGGSAGIGTEGVKLTV